MDGFKLDDAYSMDEEYTRSTNKKGFGESIYVKVPPEIAGELGALVASRKIPELRTMQDAVRSAIVHRLHHWAEIADDGQIARIVQTEMSMCRTERYIADMQALDTHIAKMREAGQIATQNQDWQMVVELTMEAREAARHTREPYSSRFETQAATFVGMLPARWVEQLALNTAQ